MRIFIYEHTCALSASTPALESLQTEGRAMLAAVQADFSRLAEVEVTTLEPWDATAFRVEAAQAEYSLLIAPESDGVLASLCEIVEQVGGRLLGPSATAVRMTSDKLLLSRFWTERQIPTPPTQLIEPGQPLPVVSQPCVLKPRDGAGSQVTFLARSPPELTAALQTARMEGYQGDLILQPYQPGQAVSVAWLVGPQQQLPLLPAEQTLSHDGRFHYEGGRLPIPADWADRAVRLSRGAVLAIPGLLGYVGVDMVLGDAADGSLDSIIELNPRLTTSYIGLRVLAQTNLAAQLLHIVQGQPTPPLTWHPQAVQFRADGRIVNHA